MPTLLKIHVIDGHPQHELVWKKSQVPFICDGCKELGFGVCYQCPHKKCNYILHEQCAIRRPSPPFQQVFPKCNFQFHKENPLGSTTRVCDICASDIQGFLYQCTREDHDLHPHCASLPPVFSLPDSNTEIYLRKEIKSRCLKCQSKKRSGLSYVSSDGKLCYHVACLKEACLENWKKGYFQLDVIADDENKCLALQNLAPKHVVLRSKDQSSKARKGIKWVIIFLKLLVSAIFGEPLTLLSTLFQLYEN
ncbi:uncharacterized protein LOC108462558 [Gossypium arboreum]|uniref:DC1 domain-containing protein n=1 Tax=Gossypium arboreum TaxID=29729 RepID=A0ABR0NL81_GOSAR|nr:uncharacterized protein LOC108462558 [Gossypium arboreum]KAK5795407.1 hypothetical protein PVK06_036671 [Gossypium arboreum]